MGSGIGTDARGRCGSPCRNPAALPNRSRPPEARARGPNSVDGKFLGLQRAAAPPRPCPAILIVLAVRRPRGPRSVKQTPCPPGLDRFSIGRGLPPAVDDRFLCCRVFTRPRCGGDLRHGERTGRAALPSGGRHRFRFHGTAPCVATLPLNARRPSTSRGDGPHVWIREVVRPACAQELAQERAEHGGLGCRDWPRRRRPPLRPGLLSCRHGEGLMPRPTCAGSGRPRWCLAAV